MEQENVGMRGFLRCQGRHLLFIHVGTKPWFSPWHLHATHKKTLCAHNHCSFAVKSRKASCHILRANEEAAERFFRKTEAECVGRGASESVDMFGFSYRVFLALKRTLICWCCCVCVFVGGECVSLSLHVCVCLCMHKQRRCPCAKVVVQVGPEYSVCTLECEYKSGEISFCFWAKWVDKVCDGVFFVLFGFTWLS